MFLSKRMEAETRREKSAIGRRGICRAGARREGTRQTTTGMTSPGSRCTSAVVATQRIDSAMKYGADRPYADPQAASCKLVEITAGIEPVQDGRIYIELVNTPFLKADGSGAEVSAGAERAVERGWLELRESGTYVRITKAGSDLFPR